jgi:hypothetical protein
MEHHLTINTNNVNDTDYKYSLNFMKYLIHGNILDRYKKDQLHNPESRTIKSFVDKMKKQDAKKQQMSAKEVAEGKKKNKEDTIILNRFKNIIHVMHGIRVEMHRVKKFENLSSSDQNWLINGNYSYLSVAESIHMLLAVIVRRHHE